MSSALSSTAVAGLSPRMPSGPGWFFARVSAMNAGSVAGSTSSPVPGMPSGPRRISGSSSLRGTKTKAPLLTVWSTPWSKNWPKNVKSELNGGDRPTSVGTFGMKRVSAGGGGVRGRVGDEGRLGGGEAARRHAGRVRRAGKLLAKPGVALRPDRELGRRDRRRVCCRLVDDQVADHARLRVDDVALLLLVARRPRGRDEGRRAVLGVAGQRIRVARGRAARRPRSAHPRGHG